MNVPVMFYTPDNHNFVENVNLLPGLKQEIMQGEVEFSLNKMLPYDWVKNTDKYYPLIVSINYSSQGQNYAFICYCVFVKNGDQLITGVRTVK